MTKNGIDIFLSDAAKWGSEAEDISAILLVGSHTRGEARLDSDIDLVIISNSPESYFQDQSWLGRFGHPERSLTEDWGMVQSLRVWFKGGLEVEFGFTSLAWIADPLDPGTQKVLNGGFIFLVDKSDFINKIGF